MKKLLSLIALFAIIYSYSYAVEPKCIFNVKCTAPYAVCKKSIAGIQKFLKLQLDKSGWAKVNCEGDYNYVILITVQSLSKNKSDCIEKVSFDLKLIRGETVLRPEKSFTQHFDLSYNLEQIKTKTLAKTQMEKKLVKGDIEDRQFDVASAIYDRIEEWVKKMDNNKN